MQTRVWIALSFVLLAGCLRFYKLGDWPFAVDEVPTLEEVQSLVGSSPAAPDSQAYRLPRLIPVGYWVIHLSTAIFGYDEYGSRVLLAAVGAVMVGMVFLLLDPLLGRPAALGTAVLVAIWPEHLFQSQHTRFYSVAAFFSALMVLTGGLTARQGRARWAWAACGAGLLAVLSHTVTAVLFPVVALGALGARFAAGDRRPVALAAAFGTGAVALGVLYLLYLRPLMQGWNAGADWAYSPAHSALAAVSMVGWPVGLLAGLGFVLMWFRQGADRWYWLASGAGCAAAVLALPVVMVFQPSYIFPLVLAALILAGFAVATVYEQLGRVHRVAATVWFVAACSLNLPGLVSHYADGNRYDMRTAAHFVRDHWRPGDTVTAFSVGTFSYYARECQPAVPLPQDESATQVLAKLAGQGGRVWVVVSSARGGLPAGLEAWLLENTTLRLQVERRRFDYAQNTMEVFLIDPVAGRSALQLPGPGRGAS
jgi:hypothetical protein